MIAILISLIIVSIVLVSLKWFTNTYDAKRQKLFAMVIDGSIPIHLIKSRRTPRDYAIIYKDKFRDESLSFYTKATNDLEAQYNFFKETGESILRIMQVQKL